MYCLLALALASWSLPASVTATPIAADVLAHRPVVRHDVYSHHPKRSMIKRDANTTFDLGFELKDKTLFSGEWEALGGTFSLDLACADCKTFGKLEASAEFPEDLEDLLDDLKDLNPLNDASLSVGFQGVGALVDLTLTTAGEGQFVIPLFVAPTPLGVSGPGFQVGITFGVDLVLGITGEITTEGGFQVAIPDGSSFKIPLDPSLPNVAKFDGASASLLPLSVDAPANLTIALRLSVEAGIELPSSPLLEAKAVAGAFINIPEVIIGEQFTTAPEDGCILPATAEININAGVFVDVGVDIGDIDLVDFNPTLSTTLFSAATSTCFISQGQETGTAALPPLVTGTATGTGTGAVGAPTIACPVALVTETATAASTFSITQCAVAAANCPSSLAQVVVVTEAAGAVTSRCPVTAPFANSTAAATGGATVSLSSLTAPVVNTLTVDPAVQTPDVPVITGSARSPPGEAAPAGVTVTMTAAPVMVKPEETVIPVKVVTTTLYQTVAPPCEPVKSPEAMM
ncbi:hypothetical protein F5Y04DRAFT_101874 [Hypomontagnella monticulosa]|nr:hypothetical protein F5Y04DRAFT_101874 [Hypomontagnella monticulosa]